jgi:hypothetical protein
MSDDNSGDDSCLSRSSSGFVDSSVISHKIQKLNHLVINSTLFAFANLQLLLQLMLYLSFILLQKKRRD